MHDRLRPWSLVLAACAAAFVAPSARAQGDAPEPPLVRADCLFREGKAALEASRFGEACPKLAESQRLDPGTGTLLALALCHEGSGQTASAWREFHEVVVASQKGRSDWAALAERHAKGLERLLSTVTVSVPAESRSQVHIRIDGDEVTVATWASPIPMDPGDHSIEASAPGTATWKSTFHVGPVGDTQVLAVPPLAPLPAAVATAPVALAAPAPAPEPPVSKGMGTRHTVGWVVGSAGAVALAVGGGFGAYALMKRGDATSLCPMSPCPNGTGVSDNNQAVTAAWVADFGIGLGLVGIGTAAYLLLTHTDPRPSPTAAASSRVHIVPSVGPGVTGLSLAGVW